MYETFDHTADLGLRIRAADLERCSPRRPWPCSRPSSRTSATVGRTQHLEVTLRRRRPGIPAVRLAERAAVPLRRANTCCSAASRCTSSDDGLTGTAWGEPLDRARHALGHEVKAITYHGLRVEQTADGWLAEVIVDI